MQKRSKFIKSIEQITKTGFLVSIVSYVTFWIADLIQPGFVSRYFSVHIFLLTTLVFGIFWSRLVDIYTDRPKAQYATAIVFGVLISVIAWNTGRDLADYRILTTAIALVTPYLVYTLIKK